MQRSFLTPGLSVHDVADRCRAAGVEFLVGSSGGWGRHELANWMTGAYAIATREVRLDPPRRRRRNASATLEATTVEALILRARAGVIETLERSTHWGSADPFAPEMIAAAIVAPVTDEHGAMGYVALDIPSMRLVNRVASLFVTDYLTRPADYVSVAPCEQCGGISFAWDAYHADACDAVEHRSSRVVAKNGEERSRPASLRGLARRG